MPGDPRGGYPLVGGFESDEARDAAMTAASTEDIAWIRPGKGKRKSGTQQNLDRRVRVNRELRLAERAAWPRLGLEHVWDDFGDEWVPRSDPAYVELSVPVPPDFQARYRAARSEFARLQVELRRLVNEAEALGDATRPGV